jgi:hypothetical protein
MKGELRNIDNSWVVIPSLFYKDMITQLQYPVHPDVDRSTLKERVVEFEIVKYKSMNVAILDISFTKPGFIEKRIKQMQYIQNKNDETR